MSRRAALRRASLAALGTNAVLAAAKGAVFLATGSLAVGSEAVNSLADTVSGLVVAAGLYLTTRPPDADHPHGHERIEPFVSLAVAAGVVLAGLGVLWGAAGALLAGPTAPESGAVAVAVLAAGAAVKYLLYRYTLSVGRQNDSPALVAAARDNRADVLTAGAALAGVAGATLGYPVLDPLAAGAVACAVVYTGIDLARDNVDYLVGRAPSEDLRGEIRDRARDHDDVLGVHDLVAHYVGPEVDVSLHVEVADDHTLAEAHDIETEVASRVGSVDEVDDVFVHIDPEAAEDVSADDDPGPVGDRPGR